jgi:hypothetical protein
MKKSLLIITGAVLYTGSLFAQLPSITATNQIPAVGDTLNYDNANSFGFDPDGGGGVTNVDWDFQSISTTSSFSAWYEDPSGTVEAANFPTATVALTSAATPGGYEYFSTTASTISRLGYTDPANASIYYTPGWERYIFPIDPGVSNAQTYTGDMTSLGAGEDSVTIDNGNYQAVGDSYGTLKLPAQVFGGPPEIFEDVIRVHVIESFQIKAWILGTPALIVNVNDDYYFYFDEETKEPVLIYGTTTDDAGGTPQTVLRYQPIPGTGVASSVQEADLINMSVFPNPVNDILTVNMSNLKDDATLTITNMLGAIVSTEVINSGATQQQVNVSQLGAGVYNVNIVNELVSSTKKIVIR